ncbi:hypothetical protein QFC19_000028 [Naganishia cerealis]|uniref:Uncharacterized protein n=1 Tax=Naganishia cerealis TaxID=610337 RepID=A0ACC2WRQ3_9TREE|nr:hypothetical protein QFC19_000028 [Naganishia cerealis]
MHSFGPLGKITIGNVLKGMLRGPRFARLTTPEAIGPLLPEEYIEHVLVIEVALLFIAQDMQQEKEDGETFSPEEKRARALQILKESREYGRQRFGIGSEYIAEEDWGNGATQMVIADVRGLNRDSEDEDENDDDQTTSSDQETETEQQQELQPQPHCGRMNEMDDGSDSGNRATRSSPHRIDDDDDDDDDEIRQALVTPEVLPIDLSPVRSFGARNSHSPIPAADDVDHARTLGSSPPLSNAPRRLDDPISLTHLSDDEFDNPAVTLDNQEVIDAANVVEETFFQNEMRKNASNSATTTPQAARKRPAPKFAEVVDVTSPPARSGAFNHNSRGSRVTRDTGASLVGPRKRNHLNLNQGAVVLDLDGVDPLDNNIGREHQSLASRTQIRPHSAGGRAQSGARSSAGTGLPRSGGSGFSNRPNSGGYQAPNGSPYSYTQGRQGGRQIGLSRIVGSSAASSNGQQGSRRAPHSAGPSGAFGPDRDRAGGARRGGSAVGTTLFHNKTRIQALQNARLDQAMWEKKSGGG